VKSRFLETIKAVDGQVQHIDYHQKRYEEVIASLEGSTFLQLKEHIKAPSLGLYRCRVVYDKKGIVSISYHKYEKKIVQRLKLIEANTLEYAKKYENRVEINKLFEKKGDCDDILIVKDSYICDTSIANVAFFNGTNWLTPKRPLLKGTTRARLIKDGFLVEEEIMIEDLKKFSQIALMNAMIDFDIIQNKKIGEIIC
jgi:4-amino-4-deoxychorismate lyase